MKLAAKERAAEWLEGARGRLAGDPALARVLSWIRTIALEDDAFCVDGPHGRGVFRFPFPSSPGARPARVACGEDDPRVRFLVRVGHAPVDGDVCARRRWRTGDGPQAANRPGWRAILHFDGLHVSERDAPHGGERPLRLGLTEDEGRVLLAAARAAAERFVAGGPSGGGDGRLAGDTARLSQRSALAVAMWTRGRLRGSIVCAPGRAIAIARRAGEWVCQDARFEPPVRADLADTVFQVGLLHAPTVPLARREIRERDAYGDKAYFVSEGTRFGAYLPEVFNVGAARKLGPLLESLARNKAGLDGLSAGAAIEACEVSEVVESSDRSRAVALEGPVARPPADGSTREDAGRAAGEAACAWLAAIQADDGSWPVKVRPSTGAGEGSDAVRTALTAHGLAAFGVAAGVERAVDAARDALGWVDRSQQAWARDPGRALLMACYRGRAALCLGDEAGFSAAAAAVRELAVAGAGFASQGLLARLHAASFSLAAAPRDAGSARLAQSLGDDLGARFDRARDDRAPMSLAGWAELVAVFPRGSPRAREAAEWLRARQLGDGSFPDTTASRFAYSRGTGKIFEALALAPADSRVALERSLAWLRAMQYRPDAVFFVPEEHRARVLGGLRHDVYDTDAWIDAAGHLLIGVARLAGGLA